MADKQLKISLVGDSSSLDKALSKAQKDLVQFSDKMKSIGQSLSIGLTAPLVAAGAASIKFASDLNESLNKVDVAFKSSSNVVKDFAKTSMKSYGIAEGSALDMSAMFGDMATGMGISTKEAAKMSTQLVALAGDMASFKNINISEAVTGISGIFTGETESLKRLGTVQTEENLKLFALSKGFKTLYDDMSQGEKVMVRFQYLLETQKNSLGDFERTQGGAANQMRIFQESLKELGATFGKIILPLFTDVLKVFNSSIQSFKNLSTGTKTLIISIGGLAALAGPLLFLAGTVIPKVIVGFGYLKTAITALSANIAKTGIIGLLVAMTGYVASQQMAYSSAIKSTNDLSDAEKNNVSAIKAKNKELYNAIALLEKEKIEAQRLDAIEKSRNKYSTSNTAATVQAEIDKKRALIVSNRDLIKSAQDLANSNAENEDGVKKALPLTAEQIAANEKVRESWKSLSQDIKMFDYEFKQLQKDIADFNNEQILKAPSIGKPKALDEFQKANLEILKTQSSMQGGDQVQIKSPFEVMAERIQPAIDTINIASAEGMGYIEGWNQKITEMQQMTASAFESIGMSIVNSLGLGNSALGSFIAQIGSALIKMAALSLAEQIFAKKKIRSEQASAQATGIKIGTNAAAAAGPAGLLLLAPAIASAMGIITGAFGTVPAFAAGGIVSGPTMGLMGEYPGAKSNPEVIAPLSKLQGMLDGGNGGNNLNLSGEFVVRGQDLILALQRADKIYNRLG
jgi:hypothetical protein